MIKEKCTQCGQCCLSSPCFMIPIGNEKYEIINNKKIHKCKFQQFIDGKSICRVYKKFKHTGLCTNHL